LVGAHLRGARFPAANPPPPLTLFDSTHLTLLDPVLCWAGLPFHVRLCFGQPCSPCESGRFRRPSPRSAYTYTPSGASPAVIVSLSKVPPGFGPKQSRAWHLWSSSARCSRARPLSRSLRRRSRRLRGDTRRNASSPGYRLLALRRVSPRIRRTASPHVAQFGTRPLVPCLTFHKARFLRSLCARRRSAGSLNLVRGKSVATLTLTLSDPNPTIPFLRVMTRSRNSQNLTLAICKGFLL
jgi:hypothetical protein